MPETCKLKICVIGAGASGLCAVRHLLAYNKREDAKRQIEPVVFEKSYSVGGLWNYEEDENNAHSSIYKGLRSNLPKENTTLINIEIMGFPDFPFPPSDHSFLGHEEVAAYLKSYAKHFGLENFIKLGTEVKSVNAVDPSDRQTAWKVETDEGQHSQVFDAVIVCNGHFTVPWMPKIRGLDKFKGSITHSHTYRRPDSFTGQSVVVAGSGASGTDIALEICSRAETVYLSHNKGVLPGRGLPSNLVQIAVLDECIGDNEFRLTDGFNLSGVDAVVCCTGYKYDFPFLNDGCGVQWSDGSVGPLYQHIVNIKFPSMGFIGLISKTCPLPSFDIQARFLVNHIMGRSSTAFLDSESMKRDLESEVASHLSSGFPMRHFHTMLETQWDYYPRLATLGETETLPKMYEDIFKEVFERRYNFLTEYRADVYKVNGVDGSYTRMPGNVENNG